ncbi:hypothetical protein IVB41_08220 [Bradyrhizobium sp. 44]|uniref:hypothetical protein n=1 Tax=Bradyrhizobium sp. 44 TaxID=2782675 RepID=UPI001FF9202C|nr:hypothetical protein [Bradyrhizobium sp. 44]MCK1283922.1 hypothetical protein [Bradyrhizobium sp. 44]
MQNSTTPQDLANQLAAATQTTLGQSDNHFTQSAGSLVDVDFQNPASVYAAISQMHPFGDMLRPDGIADACEAGRGQELLALSIPPVVPHFDTVPFSEIVPTIDFIQSFDDLHQRAEAICRTRFYATCAVSRALIEEVADVSPLGALAQAYLSPPKKPERRRAARLNSTKLRRR